MSGFFLETEAKIFCLLIIGFLWFFQLRSPQKKSNAQKLAYLFSAFSVLLSCVRDITYIFFDNANIQNICDAAFGINYALITFFMLRYVAETKEKENKTVFVLASAVLGIMAYFVSKCGVNTPVYLALLAVISVFAVKQHDEIRVDNLTKLYNRYGMDEEIKEQLSQYAREKSDSFYIISCDLDNFKYINDTWGHLEGDRALVLISAALTKACEKFDAEVFRIGGDEFVIITDTSEEGLAALVAEEVKKEIDSINFRDDFEIKISLGTALYNGEADVNELLESADKKMYEAKKASKTSRGGGKIRG